MISTKVKAGALQMTLFIVVIIALLLATFVIFLNTYKQFNVQTDFVIETTQNANKGVEYALNNRIRLNDTTFVKLDEDYKTLKIAEDYWGFFERIFSVSSIKNLKFEKMVLVGGAQSKLDRTVLFLEDNHQPLVLVGDTRIEGLAYLPQYGIRPGQIEGHSYYGNRLLHGNAVKSEIFPEVMAELKAHLHSGFSNVDASYLDIGSLKSFENSFFNPLQLVYSHDRIYLDGMTLTGHIIVQSETGIVVEASSQLNDVVLVAPRIEIKDNVVGTFQAIATTSIEVGQNCKLNYPSALVVYNECLSAENDWQNLEENTITVNEGSIINGVLFWNVPSMTESYQPQVLINENVIINGEVYCNNNVELKGTVNGAIYTSGFVARHSGSVYYNHIYNGVINVNALPREYVGLVFESSNKSVAKWLY